MEEVLTNMSTSLSLPISAEEISVTNMTLTSDDCGGQQIVNPISPLEEILSDHVRKILKETDTDAVGFQALRDICLQSLARYPRNNALNSKVPSSSGHSGEDNSNIVVSAQNGSKSPQERLGNKAVIYNFLMKPTSFVYSGTKSKEDHVEKSDIPIPITDLAVIFSGDVIPEDFEKVNDLRY